MNTINLSDVLNTEDKDTIKAIISEVGYQLEDSAINTENISLQSVLNATKFNNLESGQFLRSDVSDTMNGDLTMSANILSDDIQNKMSGMSFLPSGYLESRPVNFRFDQNCILYVNRWGTATITSSGFDSVEIDVLFSQYSNIVNMLGKAENSYIEITGLSIGTTMNTSFYPYLFMHANYSMGVKFELQKNGVWQTLYDGTVSSWKIVEVSSASAFLTGARWTFYNIPATNSYIRNLGVISKGGQGYAWNVMKGGDNVYGNLNFKTPYTVTIDTNPVYHAGNLTKTIVDALDVDADTVDGKHASDFSLSSHTHSTYLPLTGGTMTGQITVKETKETYYNLTGTEINPANGTIQSKTLSATTTLTEVLESGQSITLMIAGANTYALTLPTITWVTGKGNIAPTWTANDTIVLWKINTTLYGAYLGSAV